MLISNGMARRGKSKEAASLEAVIGVIGIGLFLCLISPQFRSLVQIILPLFGIALASGFAFWLIVKAYKRLSIASYSEGTRPATNPVGETASFERPTIEKESLFAPRGIEPTVSEKLRNIDWFQFEKLIEMIYRHRGFAVRRFGGAKPDGGVDLIIESRGQTWVVQCKHWRQWTVGVRDIREFLGTMMDSKTPKGIFITLSGYTADAKQLADKHGIELMSESNVITMLKESGLTDTEEICGLLSDSRKFCPKCEAVMVLRTARVTGNKFWGCSNYPRCRCTLKFETRDPL